MKALLFHANSFGFDVLSPSKRLGGASPALVETTTLDLKECLVALFHVEAGDGSDQIKRICKDVKRTAEKVGAARLVVAAFGHLSNNYAPMEEAIRIASEIVATCEGWESYEVHTSPFGHNKTFRLDAKGHPDAIKHRSY